MNGRVFNVVQSDDGRLSLWSASREIPWSWRALGFAGSHEECLSHIEDIHSTSSTPETGQ